jgi:NYN domain
MTVTLTIPRGRSSRWHWGSTSLRTARTTASSRRSGFAGGGPDATRDPKGYAACTRQSDLWKRDPRVTVELRTLSYPRGWPDKSSDAERPREKGIDVALAIDFVTMAVLGEYDVGILMSTDTDLKPALEAVCRLTQHGMRAPRAEVASWSGEGQHNRRLSVPGRQILVPLDRARDLLVRR